MGAICCDALCYCLCTFDIRWKIKKKIIVIIISLVKPKDVKDWEQVLHWHNQAHSLLHVRAWAIMDQDTSIDWCTDCKYILCTQTLYTSRYLWTVTSLYTCTLWNSLNKSFNSCAYGLVSNFSTIATLWDQHCKGTHGRTSIILPWGWSTLDWHYEQRIKSTTPWWCS